MQTMKRISTIQQVVIASVFSLLLIVTFINIDQSPPAWWDEGWTLSITRNWVEMGHYGHLIDGQPRGPGLEAAYPIVAPVAASFRLFGVGVWQGRLPSAFYLIASMSLIFFIAESLYNRTIAIGSILILIFLSPPVQLHPLTLGRTVMGEMPMIFYLLAGYTVLFLGLRKSRWWILPASLLWGIAIITKEQTLPFWLASLLLPFGILILKRRWQQAGLLLSGLILSWLVSISLEYLIRTLIPELTQARIIPGLIQVVATVLDPDVRWIAIKVVLTLGLPSLVGFIFAAWKSFKKFRALEVPDAKEITKLALLGFVGSWLAWYILLARYGDRYLFPAIFVGSIFTSAFLYQLTFGFDFKRTLKNASGIFLRTRNRYNIGALVAFPILIMFFIITSQYIFQMYTRPGISVSELTDHIESITQEDDLIETYESELFFLLDRRYHYPPDEISVQIISQELISNEKTYDYDPLEADPDYLVVGHFGATSKIYEQVLASGEFNLVSSIQGYDIYSRDRENQ